MLKKDVTYTDFNDVQQTETLYFNLGKLEMMELEIKYEVGFVQFLQDVGESKDKKKSWDMVKDFILMGYGQKSEDGKKFLKKDSDGNPLSAEFEQSAAFEALFLELLSEDGTPAVDFMFGMLPADWMKEVDKDDVLEKARQQAIKNNPGLVKAIEGSASSESTTASESTSTAVPTPPTT